MTPQELKNSILQLAIQGKLVEQRPEEGTAEELFARIQEEKGRLIKEGEIKKEKPLPEVTEEEKPFDIPKSWMWVRLGNVSTYNQRKEKISANDITDDMWSLDLEDIEKESGKIINICKASERKITGDKVRFYKGQVLYSKLRPYLKKILVAPEDGICSSEMVPFNLFGSINSQYAVYFLKSPYVDFIINSVTYGVKMPRVGTDTMIGLPFPLPPLAEQKRIVAKIEELLPYIDRYEQAWGKLEQFNSRFPEDMKKSLLQYAIQGKLAEQRPEEGTAEELFAQIQEEKQQLIKAAKIKKEKPLPEITDDEKPFEIPENWKWVRLVELGSFSSGKTPDMTNKLFWENGTVNWMTSKDMKEKFLSESQMKITTVAAQGMTIYKAGTLLMVVRSGILKRMLPLCILTQQSTINQDLKAYSLFCNDMSKYMYYMLKALEPNILFNYTKRVTTVDSLKFDEFSRQMLVPLPPLSEQKRIVEKLEQLLPLCERLKGSDSI